jgi:hypothetical protein
MERNVAQKAHKINEELNQLQGTLAKARKQQVKSESSLAGTPSSPQVSLRSLRTLRPDLATTNSPARSLRPRTPAKQTAAGSASMSSLMSSRKRKGSAIPMRGPSVSKSPKTSVAAVAPAVTRSRSAQVLKLRKH